MTSYIKPQLMQGNIIHIQIFIIKFLIQSKYFFLNTFYLIILSKCEIVKLFKNIFNRFVEVETDNKIIEKIKIEPNDILIHSNQDECDTNRLNKSI